MNGRKISDEDQDPELSVRAISDTQVTLEWNAEEYKEQLSEWESVCAVDSALPDLCVSNRREGILNRKDAVVTFTLFPNQSFMASDLSVHEGRVVVAPSVAAEVEDDNSALGGLKSAAKALIPKITAGENNKTQDPLADNHQQMREALERLKRNSEGTKNDSSSSSSNR